MIDFTSLRTNLADSFDCTLTISWQEEATKRHVRIDNDDGMVNEWFMVDAGETVIIRSICARFETAVTKQSWAIAAILVHG